MFISIRPESEGEERALWSILGDGVMRDVMHHGGAGAFEVVEALLRWAVLREVAFQRQEENVEALGQRVAALPDPGVDPQDVLEEGGKKYPRSRRDRKLGIGRWG